MKESEEVEIGLAERSCVSQVEYEKIKKYNKESFEIVQEFIIELDNLLKSDETRKELNIFKVNELIRKMEGMIKYTFKKVEILLEWRQEEGTLKDIESDRYYHRDIYNVISQPVYNQILMLKIYSKKILRQIRNVKYRKIFLDIRSRTRRRLDNLDIESRLKVDEQ